MQQHNHVIERLRQRLERWRRDYGAPHPIPADLWASAVELAAQHGIGYVARALRLDYGALKRRMDELANIPESGQAMPQLPEVAFVEWLAPSLPALSPIDECAMEVEAAGGSKLRVQIKNVAPSALATIIRNFVGH